MKKFIITTDSNSDLPENYIKENNIVVIPHYYDIEGITYGDEILLTPKEFYDKMRNGSMPTTMASNPAVIRDTFRKCVNQGYDVLHISFSSALSGGYNNVAIGARDVCEEKEGNKIIVIDSLNVSLGQGMIIMKAVEMNKEGKTIEETAKWIENNKMNFCVQFTVDDLHHLHRGGRVSKATAVIGSMISVKPVLYVNEEGGLVSLTTVRGRKRSIGTLLANAEARMGKYRDEEKKRFCIVHGDSLEDGEYLKTLVLEKYPEAEIIMNTVSPSIGAHSGPGAIGLIYMGEKR